MKSHPVFEKRRIFAPGPTPIPEEVQMELSRDILHHRTKEFESILTRTRDNLQWLFQTKQPVYLHASSGTGAMEATVVNLFAPGDRVLTVNGGKFGERWGKIARAYGLEVEEIKVEWGNPVDPETIAAKLKEKGDIQGVLFQASETSTGVHHPTREIAKVVRENSDALVIVDAITALGVSPVPMDEWGLDAVVSGSQKALMLPPGLAMLALSERATSRRAKANLPKFYFNLDSEDKAFGKKQTAWTPAVSLICALDIVLKSMREVGLDAVHQHHARLAEATRRGAKGMGLELFAKSNPSTALTAVHVPKAIPEGKKVVAHLRDRFAITVAGGQDDWAGKIFRLSHLGYYDEMDVITILGATELTLKHLGCDLELGKGVGAALSYFGEQQ